MFIPSRMAAASPWGGLPSKTWSRLRTAILHTILLLLIIILPGFTLAESASRQELDAQTRELRESIRLLENERSRLGYTGADARRRQQFADLIARKRAELSAAESLRSTSPVQPGSPARQSQEQQLLDAEIRGTREEIRALEAERNKLGYTGEDARRRQEYADLIQRKRAVLSARDSERTGSGRIEATRTLDAEIRELTEEIRVLENEKSRLSYTGADARRRQKIADLISRKRELRGAKERLRNERR